jgi:hypothetical protein
MLMGPGPCHDTGDAKNASMKIASTLRIMQIRKMKLQAQKVEVLERYREQFV